VGAAQFAACVLNVQCVRALIPLVALVVLWSQHWVILCSAVCWGAAPIVRCCQQVSVDGHDHDVCWLLLSDCWCWWVWFATKLLLCDLDSCLLCRPALVCGALRLVLSLVQMVCLGCVWVLWLTAEHERSQRNLVERGALLTQVSVGASSIICRSG
jgi:hypothetical protein